MPRKHAIKQDIELGYYHVFNRGVEKRSIFLDRQDENVFLSYLRTYLLPKDEERLRQQLTDPSISAKGRAQVLQNLQLNNFAEDIILLAHCLMPNHFHFFLQQRNSGTMERFLQSVCVRYVMYFNKKYKRVGPLFQGVYRAVLVERDEHALYLTQYIHMQAKGRPSSMGDYLGFTQTPWVHPEQILTYLQSAHPGISYGDFLELPEDFSFIQTMLLENN